MLDPVFKLNPEQIDFFNLFGYLLIKNTFSFQEMKKMEGEYKNIFVEGEKEVIDLFNKAHHGYKRRVLPQFIDRSESLSALIDDPRIHNVFSGLLGEDFSYRGSDASIFENGTVWHSDTYGALFKYLNVKIAIYFEEMDADTGCFRVIPGSHQFGDQFSNNLQKMLGDNDSLKYALNMEDAEVPAQIIPTQPGDILIFDYRLKHATCFKGEGSERRSFTLCASEKILDEDIPRLREEIKRAEHFGCHHYYGEKMVATASKERMQHLEQCLAQDDVFDGR